MAAYAALLTLLDTIDKIQHHPRLPLSLDSTQVESLTDKLTFLQKFLEDHSRGHNRNDEAAYDLESRIADAACSAEDLIESHVVDRVLASSSGENKLCDGLEKFHECLQKVVDDLDLIKMEVMDEMIKGTTISPVQIHPRPVASSSWDPRRPSFKGNNFVVGLDESLLEMMDRLTGHESRRQVFPIAGMGGIGKTTLAKTVYSNALIRQHFDVRAWTTISQEYDIHQILVEIVSQIKTEGGKEDLCEMSENELKETLHKSLFGRRYLIILDDIWNIEAWDEIQLFFPDCNDGSRVVITTRLSNLAAQANDNSSYCLKMKFLNEDRSWNLFCRVVFGEENCPLGHLEETGKKIARGCKGLPLSICVVGGILAKARDEVEYWEYVAKNLNAIVNLGDNEHCLKILHISYIQLPTHLKPCFLYMGVFPEDKRIRVSEVIELWIDEGFVKPINGKDIEVVAKEYFHELIERNLISVHSLGCVRAVKYCNIHDLLRDFCLRQAEKERFENILQLHHKPQGIYVSLGDIKSDWRLLLEQKYHAAFHSLQLACSLYYHSPYSLSNTRLLRIWKKCCESFRLRYGDSLDHLFESLYIAAEPKGDINSLQDYMTLSMYNWMVLGAASDIWNMPYVRRVTVFKKEVMDEFYCDGDDIVSVRLQTLKVLNFNLKCSEEIVKRIQNIRKLTIICRNQGELFSLLCNIERFHKLESCVLTLTQRRGILCQNLVSFPNSLKKLTLEYFDVDDEMLGKIGSLPSLVKLKLTDVIFDGKEWETVEGHFKSLRFLLIGDCDGLERWKTESTHFPCLERLTLEYLKDLEEIPLDVGEIPTLLSIEVEGCSDSVADSAIKIQEEQQEQGNEDLQVRVQSGGESPRMFMRHLFIFSKLAKFLENVHKD